MSGFSGMINRQLMLLVLMAIGFIIAKYGFIDGRVRRFLSDLIAKLLLPCSVLAVLMSESVGPQHMKGFLFTIVLGFVIETFSYFFSKAAVVKNAPEKKNVLRYAIISPNAAFIGIPIIDGFYGAEGLLYLAALLIPVNIFMFFFGLRLFLPKKGPRPPLWSQLLHPCVVAALVGFVFMVTDLHVPVFLGEAIASIGSCTTAISMVLIGAVLATVSPKTIFEGSSFYFCALRLMVIPLCVLGFLLLVGAPAIITGVAVVMSGMPAAIATVVLATSYDDNAGYASKIIFLSTVLSMVTLPVLAFLVHVVLPA